MFVRALLACIVCLVLSDTTQNEQYLFFFLGVNVKCSRGPLFGYFFVSKINERVFDNKFYENIKKNCRIIRVLELLCMSRNNDLTISQAKLFAVFSCIIENKISATTLPQYLKKWQQRTQIFFLVFFSIFAE